MGDGVGDDFFIERPQVFDAAAAATQDDELAVAVAGGLQCCGNLEGGAFALHWRGEDVDLELRCAARQGTQDIAQGGSLQAGYDGQAAWQGRKRAFAFRGKQAGAFECCLEPQETLEQGALTGLAQDFDA